jgi:hypothetical protein
MYMFVRATLNDGSQFVSEFDRLNGIRNLASNVFSGRRPFPIWRVTSTEHPFSFEPTLLRTREFVNGKMLRSLQVVEPIADDHGYDPLLFRPITRVSNGTAGTYRFTPETMPEGVDADVSPDIDYPCHRHPDGRRFVILKMGRGRMRRMSNTFSTPRQGLVPTSTTRWNRGMTRRTSFDGFI